MNNLIYKSNKIINHLLRANDYWMKLGNLEQYPPRPLSLKGLSWPKRSYEPILPSITLVTPSYNQGRFLESTIRSVLNQNYPFLEYVIKDGGSRDHSVSIIRKYEPQLARWSSGPDGGQSAAIQSGFAETHGEIMAWLNSDDMLLPETLHCVGQYFARHPQVDVVYGSRIMIDAIDREIGRWVIPKHDTKVLAWADYIPQETLFWRRSLWEKVGGLDTSFQFALDWDLLLRFLDAGARFKCLPYYLGYFRVHESQKTSFALQSTGYREMLLLRKRHNGYLIPDAEISKLTLNFRWKAALTAKWLEKEI